MTHRSKQQGSAVHIVIIVALVVVILAGLGFILWQNFLKPAATDQATDTPGTSTAPPPDLETSEFATQSLGGYTLSYNYPSSWKKDGNTLTNPDGNVWVKLELIQPMGIGGTCSGAFEEDGTVNDPLSLVEWESSSMNTDAMFAKAIIKTTFEGKETYSSSFGLQPSERTQIKEAKAGDSYCATFSAIPFLIKVAEGEPATYLVGTAYFKEIEDEEGRVNPDIDSIDTIKTIFDSERATTAKRILLSAAVKAEE